MTPEEAIEHIRKTNSKVKQNTKNTNQNYSTNRRNVRREKLPDWVNQPKEEKKSVVRKKRRSNDDSKNILPRRREIANGRCRKRIKADHQPAKLSTKIC